MSARYPSSWWATRPGDLLIRAIGAASLGLGSFAMTLVSALIRSGAGHGAPALGLAALGFVSGSAGAAAIAVGRGLLEHVEISPRWRARAPETASRPGDRTASHGLASLILPAPTWGAERTVSD